MSSNPYLEARREWDERYGGALAQARNWRLAAFGSLGLAALAVAGVIYLGSQSKIQPYVAELGHLGQPIALAQPITGNAATQRIVEATVARWVWEARTVLPDAKAQKALLKRVYALLGPQAAPVLDRWYQAHSPFGRGTANPSITSELPVGPDTWQVSWTETAYRNGQSLGTTSWEANVVTGVDPKIADRPQVMLYNPLGIYIKSITWTRIIANGGSK